MVEDQGPPPPSRACSEPGKTPFLLLPQPPQRQGVPWNTGWGRSGGVWNTAEVRGSQRERCKSKTGEELQPPHPTSKRKSLPNANTVNKLESGQDSKIRLSGQGVRNEIW